MAKTAVEQWDTTAANNTDINSIPIDGAVTTPSQVDNIVREMMAQVATQMGEMNFEGADIASATTTDLANATGWSLDITGTTTITGLGTVAAGKMFFLRFTGALTFTHNATSLILPGAANITTAANDVAIMKSEGSGNWRCVSYQRASGVPVGGLPASSTDNTVPRFNGAAGALKTSIVTIDDLGTVTAGLNVVATGGHYLGHGTGAVLGLASGGAGNVFLRPRGYDSTTNQATVDTSGNLTVSGQVVSTFFASGTADVALAGGGGVMYLRPSGVGTTSNQMTLDSGGNLTAAGNITANSDERLKTDWQELPHDFVRDLAGVLAGFYTRIDTGARQVGVGAQSLQRVLPAAVQENEDGHLSVAYGQAALVCVVELAKRVLALEALK